MAYERKCLIIKTYGDQSLANQIGPAFESEERKKLEKRIDILEREVTKLKVVLELQQPKLSKYYNNLREEREFDLKFKKEFFLKRWFDNVFSTLWILFTGTDKKYIESEH